MCRYLQLFSTFFLAYRTQATMLLLSIAVGILITFIQPVEGNERAINEDWTEDHLTITSDRRMDYAYDVDKRNSYHSVDHALGNLTSNAWISLTTDVQLSSVIQLVGLTNISIVGYNDPTVNCNHGGFHLVSSYTITIRGIVWKGCGTNDSGNTHPVLQLYNSSNITIENCSFQRSVGQAIVLTGVSGDVKINQCKFLFNTQFSGHGTAILYSSNSLYNTALNFTITNTDFCYNEGAESIVYFGRSFTMLTEYILIHNCNFSYNKGVPVYLSNTNLYFNGNNEFYGNTANNGAGIFISDYSNVLFHQSAIVNFRGNVALSNGGAVYLNNRSSILFNNMSSNHYHATFLNGIEQMQVFATFDSNKASISGGAIFSHNSNVVFGKGTSVIFKENIVSYFDIGGGAMYIDHNSTVTFEGNCTVTFNKNFVRRNGGAMYIDKKTQWPSSKMLQ